MLPILMPLASVPFLVGKRLLTRRAKDLLGRDSLPPVLLLRSFRDDRMSVRTMSTLRRVLFLQYFPWNYTTFEEMLVGIFEPFGPVVAIGRPREVLPPFGAAREWLDNDKWQARVDELLARCRFVVFMVGDLEGNRGLQWEAERVFARCPLQKVVFVIPPLANRTARHRWSGLVALSRGRLPKAVGDVLAATFAEDGSPIVLRGRRRLAFRGRPRWWRTRRWERDYRSALMSVPSLRRPEFPGGGRWIDRHINSVHPLRPEGCAEKVIW
jgi:hypothetical protein